MTQPMVDPYQLEEVATHDSAAADETLRCSIFCRTAEESVADDVFQGTSS